MSSTSVSQIDGENILISGCSSVGQLLETASGMRREITECIKTCFDGMIFKFFNKNILLLFSKWNLSFFFKSCFCSQYNITGELNSSKYP